MPSASVICYKNETDVNQFACIVLLKDVLIDYTKLIGIHYTIAY